MNKRLKYIKCDRTFASGVARVALLSALALAGSTSAFSDFEVTPKGATGWGDPSEAEKMLQMTKDPEVVHTPTEEELDHRVPKRAAPDCTENAQGELVPKGCVVNAGNPNGASGVAGSVINTPSSFQVNPVQAPTPRGRLDGAPNGSGNQGFSVGQ